MLKVNLLPPYIHMRKKLRMAIIFVVILLIAEVGGLLYAETGPSREFDRLTRDLAQKQSQLDAVKKVKGDTDKVVAEEGSFKPKYEFLTGTINYNKIRPDLYDRTQRHIYKEVMLLDLAAEQNSMQFSAYVSDPVDVSRLMLGLTRSPDFTGLPQVTGVPGFGQQEKQRREAEGGSLPDSNIIGSESSRPTAIGSGGGGGGMMPGGMGGGMMAGPGGMGGGMMGGPGGMGAGPNPSMMAGMGAGRGGGGAGMMSGGMMGGMGGMGGGMGGGSGSIDKLNIQDARQKPRGFTVQVKAELKNTITRPSYMSSEQQAGKGGGGGGMGGMMMGGMGGMSMMGGMGSAGMMSGGMKK